MIRRLNYTQRKPLTRKQVAITLDGEDDPPAFSMNLDLGRARFPENAMVIVEASRQTSFMRWNFGTVGCRKSPNEQERRLTEFGTGDGVTFRVKIVEPHTNQEDARPACILAHADGIKPRAQGERKKRSQSLLPVDWGDDTVFQHQPWRVEFDESNDPLLRISRYLIKDKDGFVGSDQFVTIAMPEIFRSILTQVLMIDGERGEEDGTDWRSLWLKLAMSLPGVGNPPPVDGDVGEWIENAVAAFCKRTGIRGRFQRWWEKDE